MADTVIVYGASHIGIRIAEFLKDAGSAVVIAADHTEADNLKKFRNDSIPLTICDLKDFRCMAGLSVASAKSIILSSDNELFNLQAALQAVEINPGIMVVIRLFNLNLARKLEESVANFKVLSVSNVASPGFTASAIIKKNLLSFELGETIYSVYETRGETFAGRCVADIENNAAVRIIAINTDHFPKREAIISPSDTVVVFSTCRQARDIAGIRSEKTLRRMTEDVKRSFMDILHPVLNLDRVLVTVLLALAVIPLFCIAYFTIVEEFSLINAVYFVVTVMTTVGFGDIALKEYGILTKIIGMILMLSGVSLLTILFAFMTDWLVKKRMDILMGRRKLKNRSHVILCGVGDVGIRILEDLLVLGEKVVVIEKNQAGKFFQTVSRMNVPFIISDATLEETIVNANVAEAKAIICATDDDMKNLEIGLNARSLKPGIKVVLRIFDKSFAEKIEKFFNIHSALSSSDIAAPSFASAAEDMGIINTLKINGAKFILKECAGEECAKDVPAMGTAKPLLSVRKSGEVCLFEKSAVGDKIIYIVKV